MSQPDHEDTAATERVRELLNCAAPDHPDVDHDSRMLALRVVRFVH